jgi:hypothetical protein
MNTNMGTLGAPTRPFVGQPESVLDLGDLNEPPTRSDAAVIAECKLSLTRDEALEPRAVKGPFGRDFIPFM